MPGEFTRAMARRQTVNPRTVLGFYATVLLIVVSVICTLTTILATTQTATWLIPWILGFGGLLIVATLAGTFYINIKLPANLMLGQITGTEYAEISRQIILGNDTQGERTVVVSGNEAEVVGSTDVIEGMLIAAGEPANITISEPEGPRENER